MICMLVDWFARSLIPEFLFLLSFRNSFQDRKSSWIEVSISVENAPKKHKIGVQFLTEAAG